MAYINPMKKQKIKKSRKKEDCPLEGKCRTEIIIYKYIISTSGHPDLVYLGTTEGYF